MACKAKAKNSLRKLYKNRNVPNLQIYMIYAHPIQYNSTIVVLYCRTLSLVFTNDRFTYTFCFAQNSDTNVIDLDHLYSGAYIV